MPLVHTGYPAIGNDFEPVSRVPARFPPPPLQDNHSGAMPRQTLPKLKAVHEAEFMQQNNTCAGYWNVGGREPRFTWEYPK
ncbi:MAG TPA: hypothetical protein ENH55_14725 [Aurantimonas coralicida]|uniref:Uncharacterized protein n=1 Tax=Aurantimonas coralicida TaxID=182270 RepID=A0A9C9TH20_9HYPH|nr:hypothetical protein [Aurantimonas coralicida]HEU00333.1 hypothetical protein [Aurantimonas coralicida]